MSLSVSFQNRNLHELHATQTRNFGVQAASLPSIDQLDLRHNHLRSLECPFADLRRDDPGQPSASGFARHPPSPLPLRSDVTALSMLESGAHGAASSFSTTAPSLEEERSGLRPLTSLRCLLVSHNALYTLLGLAGAARTLTTLVATHNRLTSLDGLQACRHLRHIDVSHNAIESLRGLSLTPVRVAAADGPTGHTHAASATPSIAPSDPALVLSGIAESSDDTSSVSFSCHTAQGEEAHLRFGGAEGHGAAAAAAAAGHPSASTNTSVRFHVDGTPTAHSLVNDAAPDSPGVAADAGKEEAAAELVLILAHNRLRSKALASLLWVDGEGGSSSTGAVAATRPPQADVSALTGSQQPHGSRTASAMLLRPWSTALTHLDLSHNYIEDVQSVRRLLATVPWPAATKKSAPGAVGKAHAVVCGPVLPRLRRLDVSGNPFLANGALAKDMATAAAAAAASVSASVSQEASKGAAAADAPATTASGPTLSLHVRYESPALREALRSSALLMPPGQSALADLPSAEASMAAALRALGDDWRSTALLPSSSDSNSGSGDGGGADALSLSSASVAPFALFTAAERRAGAAAASSAGAEVSVLIYGAEVTVYAAALQQRGARLAEVLSVPRGEVGGDGAGGGPSRARASSTRQAERRVDTVDVFLTPPPRWGSGTSASTTFIQTSLLSDASPLPHAPAHQQQQQRPVREDTSSLSTAPPHATRRGVVEARVDGSEATTTSAAETSAVGYRLYQGRIGGGGGVGDRDSLHRSVSPFDRLLSTPAQRQGAADSPPRASAPPPAATPAAAAAAPLIVSPSRPSPAANTEDAVALQVYKAEVSVLRRRFRELQRHTRDQACVVQRHEASLRALKEQVADALQGRDAAEAELAHARDEIARLRARLGDVEALPTSYAAQE